MVLRRLIWDEWNLDHIARHNVSSEEVEEVCKSRNKFFKGRGGTYSVIGQTESGRYLTIILSPRKYGNFYVVTARESDNKEKRRFKRK